MNLLNFTHLRNVYRSTGVGRVGRELTEHLACMPGIRQKLLADRHDHARVIPNMGPPWDGFDYLFFKHDTSRQQMLWYLFDRPTAEQFWPDVDVVYCTAESYVPVHRAKLAVLNHDMQLFEPAAHPPSRWLSQQRMKWRLLFRRLRKRASMFHAISQFSADRLAHYFPGVESRTRVIPNAVSESFFHPAQTNAAAVLRKLSLPTGPYLLVPGGLHFRKNAELILQVWPLLAQLQPELQLLIMGHNSPAYVERAEALGDRVAFTGFREEDEIVALYQGAEAVWFPSRYEGFGMPVLESMACGTAVVTTAGSALPETAGGAAFALLSPDRPRDHVEALSALIGPSSAKAEAVQKGRLRAGEFTWARSSEMLARTLTQL